MIMTAFRRLREFGAPRPADEGSALVELALSLPLLCFILLGAAEFARVAYASIEVVNAAHAAALYAAAGQAQLSDSAGISNAAATDAAVNCGGSSVSVTAVTPSCTCSNTAYTPTSCSDNTTCINNNSSMITTVTVTTSCSFSPLISTRMPGMQGVNGPFTLSGRSIQVVSNQ